MEGKRHHGMLVALAVAALAAGCGGATTVKTAPSTAPPAPATQPPAGPPTTASHAPTAARDLAAYFRAATRSDARLRAAAARINGEVTATGAHFSADTVAAVKAADPTLAGRLVPAGLASRMLGAVILVQSDLISRWYALRPVLEPSTGVPREDRERLHACFGAGAPAAARFAADLAAARAVAAGSPTARHVDPASHAAAEVPLQLQNVILANVGCDSCGGQLATTLPVIRWHRRAAGAGLRPFDGTIGGIFFRARYAAGSGWQVQLNAC